MNLLLKNIAVISPLDKINSRNDILIKNGIISKIDSPNKIRMEKIPIVNGTELTCIPGLFDMHVHFRDPGQTEKESLESGSESAMNGGFTGVLCMPNTKPPLSTSDVILDLYTRAKDYAVDILLSGCVSEDREGKKIADLKNLYNAGVIAFTDDGNAVVDEELMKNAFKYSVISGAPIMQHCELPEIMKDGVINEGVISKKLNVPGISNLSETEIIKRDIEIANSIKGSKYHIQHISCGKSVSILRDARKVNKNITSEVCPHHFILTDDAIEKYNANAKMNPPLRTNEDVEEILKGIADNTIDVICTDHAPHTLSEKYADISKAPFGIIGLESCLGLTYTYLVKKNIISIEKMIEKMSINPRRLLGLKEIHIKENEKANLTLIALDRKWNINIDKFKSKGKNTPFNNWEVYGKPFAIVNNNKIVYSNL